MFDLFVTLKHFLKTESILMTTLSLIILMGVCLTRIERINDPLLSDESYHVTDSLVAGKMEALNPFTKNYQFHGHPPGYPISLYLWMGLFGKTVKSAKLFHFILSTFTLMAFFILLNTGLPWHSSLIGTLFLFYTPLWNQYSSLCLADIPSLLFFLLSIIFILKTFWKSASLSLLLFFLYRESAFGLLLPLWLLIAVTKIKGETPLAKSLFQVALPTTITSVIFFGGSLIFHQTFSNHPYAASSEYYGSDIVFFSLSYSKWLSFERVYHLIFSNLPKYGLSFFILGLILFLKNMRNGINNTNIFKILLLTTSLNYFAFFVFYEDTLGRDVLLCLLFVLFIVFYGIQKTLGKFSPILFLFFFTPLMSKDFTYDYSTYLNLTEKTKTLASYLEKNHVEDSMCLPHPLRYLKDRVHGYFENPKKLDFDCDNPDMVVLSNLGNKEDQSRIQKLIDRHKLVKIKEINLNYGAYFRIYVQPD